MYLSLSDLLVILISDLPKGEIIFAISRTNRKVASDSCFHAILVAETMTLSDAL